MTTTTSSSFAQTKELEVSEKRKDKSKISDKHDTLVKNEFIQTIHMSLERPTFARLMAENFTLVSLIDFVYRIPLKRKMYSVCFFQLGLRVQLQVVFATQIKNQAYLFPFVKPSKSKLVQVFRVPFVCFHVKIVRKSLHPIQN